MRVFVTGASGWIGSAAIQELQKSGHQILGLARSDESATKVAALGAEVHRGSLDDLDSLRAGAADADAVVHLGYSHDFSRMVEAAAMDRTAIETMGQALEDRRGALFIASGTLGLAPGHLATEQDQPDPNGHPRIANANLALSYADRGVRASAIRFSPTVHGEGDHGFIAVLVAIARAKGVSGYIGDGSGRWSAVHRFDAGKLVALAVDKAPAGSILHAVGEEGVPTRDIAEAIGAGLGLPVESIPADQAIEHFDWMGRFFGIDSPASNTATRELLGWEPTHQGLIEDLKAGYYF